ncbi:Indoleamine 2,3-dioxygenase [Vermiconidia calcicola]|uniref:Indoleamine 2,3-dioxygenase n=1 Tax=Vermiconidia calcicola TaxID=1690605 RepID=A0ACC3N3I4_9PEZI|nr:Indoleamine 2,3-dioxygenase [Vermiconidia calcicola]
MPLRAFDDPYYEPWDNINSQLSTLISSGTLDEAVEKIPLLKTDRLDSELEYRRAYVVLAFLVHAHVWSRKPPNECIPAQIAEPFLEVCNYLRLGPVLSYAGLCSWNWTILETGSLDLRHMETLSSFTGTRGEAAFYHVPVLIEREGGSLVHLLIGAVRAAADGSRMMVLSALEETAERLARMGEHLGKMYSRLDSRFFYHELRPFFAGGKGMEDKGLPRGMVFQRSNGSELHCKFTIGGSAAQSSLFHFLDCMLGVVHRDDSVFNEMRAYMPGAHRDFLEEVSKLPSLRVYVEEQSSDLELQEAYDACLTRLRAWRGKHIAMVSKYIVQPAREVERAAVVGKLEVDGPGETDKEWELQGTGGSALIPFLRQARDDTVGIAA